MNQQQLRGINVQELATKCKSKRELYNFLAQDCHAFLPKQESTNIYFLKQIMRAQKEVTLYSLLQRCLQYLKRDNVKVSAVPHIEGLTVQDFLDYASTKAELLRFLPDERDWVHLDRAWVTDLLYTLDHQGISDMIRDAMLKRKQKLEQNRDLVVEMRPEFADALSRCLNFSTERGKAVNLVKSSSMRKRTHNEIEDVKEEEEALKQDKQMFLQLAKRLKEEHKQMEEQIMLLRRDKDREMEEAEFVDLDSQVNDIRL